LVDRDDADVAESGTYSSKVPETVTDELSLPRNMTSVAVRFVTLHQFGYV